MDLDSRRLVFKQEVGKKVNFKYNLSKVHFKKATELIV